MGFELLGFGGFWGFSFFCLVDLACFESRVVRGVFWLFGRVGVICLASGGSFGIFRVGIRFFFSVLLIVGLA